MGVVFAITTLAFGGMSPIAGKISDKAGNIPVILTGMFFLGCSIPTLALPDSIYLETVAMVIVGVASALTIVPTLPELARSAKESSYEQIYSTFNVCYAIGNIIGPIIGGATVHAYGFTTALLIFGGVIILYSILSKLCGKNPKKSYDEEDEEVEIEEVGLIKPNKII